MNLKDLVTKISAETLLQPGVVRVVVSSVLEVLRSNVEAGEDFTSPRLFIRAVTTKPTEKVDDTGTKIPILERKIGRLIPREAKPKV